MSSANSWKAVKDYGELDIPNRKRGRPLLLPAVLNDLTKQFIGSLRLCVLPVSSSIVIAATCGTLIHKDMSLLKEYGGTIEL